MLNEISDAGTQTPRLLIQELPQQNAAKFQLSKIHRGLAHIENTWISLESELSLASIPGDQLGQLVPKDYQLVQ